MLVDCLTLWLSNLMFCGGHDYPEVGEIDLPARFHEQRAALLAALDQALPGDVVLVSNEVGMGIDAVRRHLALLRRRSRAG